MNQAIGFGFTRFTYFQQSGSMLAAGACALPSPAPFGESFDACSECV